jgi:predicted nucleotidyltransferase
MRKKSIIEALLPRTRRAILAAVLLEPERAWYLSVLTAHLGRRNPSSLQRELESLVAAEILIRRQEGNRVYFQANRDCPVFPELAGLFAKTTGMVDVVRKALRAEEARIRLAFIYGSIARTDEGAASDIDLLIVGGVGLADVSSAVRIAERELRRAINVSVYSTAEFAAKAGRGHHFLTSVLSREKIFLIGNEYDLEELAHGRTGPTPRYEQAGTG